MRSYRLALDRETRDIVAIGKDGRQYSLGELELAEEGAARGDPEALATIREVELVVPDPGGEPADEADGDQAGAYG